MSGSEHKTIDGDFMSVPLDTSVAFRGKDLTGKRFGRLVVLRFAGHRVYPAKDRLNGHRHAYWSCMCDCGNPTVVRGRDLTQGNTTSCSCYQKTRAITHGQSTNLKQHPIYSSWKAMMQRCHNPNSPSYVNYGGAGKLVCERWHDFRNFLADMGSGWQAGLSLGRIKNELGYSAENCEWQNHYKQARNKSNNRWLTHNGNTRLLGDWARLYSIHPHTLASRLKNGWPMEKALTVRAALGNRAWNIGFPVVSPEYEI